MSDTVQAVLGIVSPILSLIGVIVSVYASFRIAKNTARAEIEKLSLTWAHERDEHYEKAYAELLAAVTIYLDSAPSSYKMYCDAIQKVSAFRVIADESIDPLIGELSDALSRSNGDFRRAKQLLGKITAAERKHIAE